MRTFYIDWNRSDDSGTALTKETAWKRHPFMQGFTGSYTHIAGDRFIFRGGVTWPNSCFTLNITESGSAGNIDYYGVDQTWYKDGDSAWSRPIFDAEFTATSHNNHVWAMDYIEMDNIEFIRYSCTRAGGAIIGLRYDPAYLQIRNCYFHNWAANLGDALVCVYGITWGDFSEDVIVEDCTFDSRPTGVGSGCAVDAMPIVRNCQILYCTSGHKMNGTIRQEFSGNTFIGQVNPYEGNPDHSDTTMQRVATDLLLIFNNTIAHPQVETLYPAGSAKEAYIFNNIVHLNNPVTSYLMMDLDGRGCDGTGKVYIWNNTIDGNLPNHSAITIRGSFDTVEIRNNHIVGCGQLWNSDPQNPMSVAHFTESNNLVQTDAEAYAYGYTSATKRYPNRLGVIISVPEFLVGIADKDMNGIPRGTNWDAGSLQYDGIAFPTAPTVAVGETITSTQWNAMAHAWNDRLGSGLGDPTWRIWWKAFAMMREVRTFSEGLYPAQDEWFSHYMHVDPNVRNIEGPLQEAHPMYRWVFGNTGLDPEYERINAVPMTINGRPPVMSTLADVWELGKAQRGGYCPTTSEYNAPQVQAATAHWPIYSWARIASGPNVYDPTQNAIFPVENDYKWHKTYGGFARGTPMQTVGLSTYPVRKFTHLRDAAYNITYSPAYAPYPTFIDYLPDRYRLTLTDEEGNPVEENPPMRDLLYSDYVEGPYTDGGVTMMKQNNFAWNEILLRYNSTFKGADSQRTDDSFKLASISFDFDKFFRKQFRLAPALAEVNGGEIEPIYPIYAYDGYADGRTMVINNRPGFPWYFDFNNGFVLVGAYINVESLSGPVTLAIIDRNTSEVFKEIELKETGSQIKWFDPTGSGSFMITVNGNVNCKLTFEAAPLMDMTPNLCDAYVMLRRLTTRGENPDTEGYNYTAAKSICDNYFTNGCYYTGTSLPAPTEGELEQTPLYNVVRKTLRSRLRFFKRGSLLSYAVEDGKAVLTFNRFVNINTTDYDAWDGVAPPLDPIPSGKLQSGLRYRVAGTSGWVRYNGLIYSHGGYFYAQPGVRTYEILSGDVVVKQYDGIITVAPEMGETNEWLMFMSFNGWGGVGKDMEAYGDPLNFLHNRCLGSNAQLYRLGPHSDLNDHINFGQDYSPTSEAPSGFTYIRGLNESATEPFFKSCEIYPPDYVVESITCPTANTVRVQLSTRLDNNADSTVRTDENAILEYLEYVANSVNCDFKYGDAAADASVPPLYGACCPRFYFTKAVPRVFVDTPDNNTLEPEDTRPWADDIQWLNFMLDAICEGYIDEEAMAAQILCQRKPHYTFVELCRQVLGQHWHYLLPSRILPNYAQGLGPPANMRMYIEHFNGISSCLNTLRTVPIDIPYPIEWQFRKTAYRRAPVAADEEQDNIGGFLTPCAFMHYGTPTPDYRNVLSEDEENFPIITPTTFEYPIAQELIEGDPVYDTQWGDTVTPGAWSTNWAMLQSLPAALGCGGPGNGHYSIPADENGNFLTMGIEMYCCGYSFPRTGDPLHVNVLTRKDQLRIRLTSTHPSIQALRSDLQQLVTEYGTMGILINDLEWWVTNDGPTEHRCGENYAAVWDVNLPYSPTRRQANSYRCLKLPIKLNSDPVEILPRPLQPSMVAAWHRPFGFSQGCYDGPASLAYINFLGSLYAKVPLT